MAQVFIPGWLLSWITVKQGTELYHFNYSYKGLSLTSPDDATLLAIATAIYNFAAPGLQPILSTSCQILSCTVRDMFAAGGHEATYVPGTILLGTSTGDPEPANVAGTMSYAPAVVGKGVRGRTFISGIAESTTANQVLTTGLVAALATLASAYRTYAGPFTYLLEASIASRKHAVLRKVVASTVTNQINNQIRRLIGHRRHKRKPVTP